MIRFSKLEDVHLPCVNPPIDRSIENLVRALIALGVETTMSCEGGRSHSCAYPLVGYVGKGFELLYLPIQNYNTKNNIRWDLGWRTYKTWEKDPFRNVRRDYLKPCAPRKHKLKEMQQDAQTLATFLFDIYLRQ